jgi:hypothetical protein
METLEDDAMKLKDNLGWQRFFRVLKAWGVMAGLISALHLVYFLGWIMLDSLRSRSVMPYVVLTIGYVVCLAWIGLMSFRRVDRADVPVEYREAHAQGQPATAKVLEIDWTGWESGRQRGSILLALHAFSLRYRRHKREYQMRLRVTRPGEADYEAQLAAYLVKAQVPNKGDTISVKVHPHHPEVVVWAQ